MDYTSDEMRDALLSTVALIRADIEGDDDGIAVIFKNATERDLRAITEALITTASDTIVRLTLAHALIEDEHDREFIRTADIRQTLADPDIRAQVAKNAARVQAQLVGDGSS